MIQAGLTGIATGLQSGIIAARRVYEDPATAYQQQSFLNQAEQYSLLWAYYSNAMFDRTAQSMNSYQLHRLSPYPMYPYNPWSPYKSTYNLYRNIRMIYNPTRRLVDFYAGVIYPGVLSEDGKGLPDGVPLAVPFSEDTPPELKNAIAQFWQWSNWQAKKSLQVRYGGALGSVLVELVDDLEHGKVTADIVWPGFIYNLALDGAGNVKQYAIQYTVREADSSTYVYGKFVDQEAFRYFRNYEPFDYGDGSIVPNPYPFVPAVWIKHIDAGGEHGSPAIAGSLGKVDELNNLASHTHDQIHKKIGSPLIMWSSGSINKLFSTQKRGMTNELDTPQASEEESVLMLKGPADGHVDSLSGELNLADAALYMTHLISEIEQDHPELTFYRELRSMSQVTGPAASRLVGDVASRVSEVQAAYDQANMSLFRMAVAICGFRANSGAWGPLNRQQQKFLPYDLGSYSRGDLDMAIMPRPLLAPTKLEVALEKQAMWTGVKLAVDAGAPLEMVLEDEGWTEEEIAEMKGLKDAQDKATQALSDNALLLAQAKQLPSLPQENIVPPVGQ